MISFYKIGIALYVFGCIVAYFTSPTGIAQLLAVGFFIMIFIIIGSLMLAIILFGCMAPYMCHLRKYHTDATMALDEFRKARSNKNNRWSSILYETHDKFTNMSGLTKKIVFYILYKNSSLDKYEKLFRYEYYEKLGYIIEWFKLLSEDKKIKERIDKLNDAKESCKSSEYKDIAKINIQRINEQLNELRSEEETIQRRMEYYIQCVDDTDKEIELKKVNILIGDTE